MMCVELAGNFQCEKSSDLSVCAEGNARRPRGCAELIFFALVTSLSPRALPPAGTGRPPNTATGMTGMTARGRDDGILGPRVRLASANFPLQCPFSFHLKLLR